MHNVILCSILLVWIAVVVFGQHLERAWCVGLFFFFQNCRRLFKILDSRKGRKSTVLVSQIPAEECYDLFKDCTYADACLDRVLCKTYRLEFKPRIDAPVDRYRYTDVALHTYHFPSYAKSEMNLVTTSIFRLLI